MDFAGSETPSINASLHEGDLPKSTIKKKKKKKKKVKE